MRVIVSNRGGVVIPAPLREKYNHPSLARCWPDTGESVRVGGSRGPSEPATLAEDEAGGAERYTAGPFWIAAASFRGIAWPSPAWPLS